MKKIMILAGGNDQIALMQELRRYFNNNVYIILVDQSNNVRAIPYADKFMPISTMDKQAVLNAAQAEQIDYILTACGDQPLSVMSFIATQMQLPSYLSEETILNMTNKKYMKKKMQENGIPTAKHMYISQNWDCNIFPAFSYPLVVKPVDSNGSKGVKKVFCPEELNESIKEALSYSISKDVIIEEFKEGEEISIDVYVENSKAQILLITSSKKISENKNSFTILQSFYPAQVKVDEQKVLNIVQKIVDVFGFTDTPLLVQMIVNENEYNVIEFSARIGGGSKYKLIEVLSGVDIMREYVNLTMGTKPKVEPHLIYKNAIMDYVYCRPGRFVKLNNFEELKRNNIIKEYFVYKMANTMITKSDTSSDRVAGFLVVGNSDSDVNEKLGEANLKLQVLDDHNNDIMRHDLLV